MTSEAAGADVDIGIASPELIALVVKREQESKGKPSTQATEATKATESAVQPQATSAAGQAEEVEAERVDADEAHDTGKPDAAKKPLDFEWAKSDTLKGRISTLHEAGHLDDELLGVIRAGVERKEHLRAANAKFEAAADKVKAANTERDQYKERAERYDRLMSDPKFHAALNATESDGGGDESLMTPEEKRIARLEKDLAEIKAEKDGAANAAKSEKARIAEIEGWAEDHLESLGSAVSKEEYEAALKATLTELYEDEIDPRSALTAKGLARRVNRVLERQRDDKEVQGLRERVDGSKRDAVRSIRASSPAGVRTEVKPTYATPRAQRIAETLAKYPLRPE